MDEINIALNSNNLESMAKLMGKYGDKESLFEGKNQKDEKILISIFSQRIIILTFQTNGWIRKNIIHKDGTKEELFEK